MLSLRLYEWRPHQVKNTLLVYSTKIREGRGDQGSSDTPRFIPKPPSKLWTVCTNQKSLSFLGDVSVDLVAVGQPRVFLPGWWLSAPPLCLAATSRLCGSAPAGRRAGGLDSPLQSEGGEGPLSGHGGSLVHLLETCGKAYLQEEYQNLQTSHFIKCIHVQCRDCCFPQSLLSLPPHF